MLNLTPKTVWVVLCDNDVYHPYADYFNKDSFVVCVCEQKELADMQSIIWNDRGFKARVMKTESWSMYRTNDEE